MIYETKIGLCFFKLCANVNMYMSAAISIAKGYVLVTSFNCKTIVTLKMI